MALSATAKKMLKRLLAFLLAFVLLCSLVACNQEEVEEESGLPVGSSDATESESESETEEPSPWKEVPKTLKVLAIGNSFSVDAMEYLYHIAKSAGVETVILGNLRISGCTLDMHWANAKTDAKSYTYLKNTTGTWGTTEGFTLWDGLKDEEWDYVTIQQASQLTGMPTSYENLSNMLDYLDENKVSADTKVLWHMTWAYQGDSTHSGFANYGKSQSKMYQAIVKTTQDVILPTGRFDGVIPSGTAVQNARTSFIGDNMTRDGYHMVQPFGRYLVGLTYFAAITGADVSKVTYRPASSVTDEMDAMAKEAVKNAVLNPYVITESSYKTSAEKEEIKVDSNNAADYFALDAQRASDIGVDLSRYTLLEYEYLTNQYYKSTSRTTPSAASSSQNEKHICFKERYSKEQLLNAVIVCDEGWQYRPEQWDTATEKAKTRPGMCSDKIVLLNDAWWGNNIYLALNISKLPQVSIAENYAEAALHVRVYVPTK